MRAMTTGGGRFVLACALASAAFLAACNGTEVGNPDIVPETDDGGLPGQLPVGAGYREDAFFGCLRLHDASSGAFVGLDYLAPPVVFGEVHRLVLDVENGCSRQVALPNWGTTDMRILVALDSNPIAQGATAERRVIVELRAAEPAGSLDQRIAIRINDGTMADSRVITILGFVHEGCATLDMTSCNARTSCEWDATASTCADRR